ncbi:retrotransposon hot spot (RHS) protein [Trypanosoma cruzi]|nr:retrotransposon hot spot (RHS) protein [Trypanosoma cruzi]
MYGGVWLARFHVWGEFFSALLEELKELRPPARRGGQYAVPTLNPQGHPTDSYGLGSLKNPFEGENLKYRLLCTPETKNFPLVDPFSLLIRRGRRWSGCR